jgi:ribosomal protein S18 acetylase RimI-like enzyme
LIGLAHYRAMPSPLRGAYLGFLDDLVVRPQDRGSDAAKLLLDALKAIGKKQEWAKIRWITRDDNYRARALYDKIATKTNWAMYEMDIDC